MSTVDDDRAAYRRDHRKPSPSDDQPRDSVYSFEDLAGDPDLRGRARYLAGRASATQDCANPPSPRTALADPRGQTPHPLATVTGAYWCSRCADPETFLARAREGIAPDLPTLPALRS